MKVLGLIATVKELGNMPGNECVEVFFDPTPTFYVLACGEDRDLIPETAKLVCAGQPDQFFVNLLNLLTKQWAEK